MNAMPVLEGKHAFVTGASGGLGRHFAEILARAGARVTLAARRMKALETIAAALRSEGREARAVRLDVTVSGSVREALEVAETAFGAIDVLINNSGVAITRPVLEVQEAEWDSVAGTNLKGAFLVAAETARHMRDAGRGGSIVNIASIVAFRPAGQVAPYAASKAGLLQLTKSMALELARHDIRVNALAPGYIASDLNRDFFATPAGQALVKRIPQRRLGRPEDLDGALLLLASDAGRYMTGSVIVVDGGHLVSSL